MVESGQIRYIGLPILDSLVTNPLGPAVPLVVGGLALVFLARWRRPVWHSVFALGVIGISGLLWFSLANLTIPAELVRPWDAILIPVGELVWRVDGWAWLGGMLARVWPRSTFFTIGTAPAGARRACIPTTCWLSPQH